MVHGGQSAAAYLVRPLLFLLSGCWSRYEPVTAPMGINAKATRRAQSFSFAAAIMIDNISEFSAKKCACLLKKQFLITSA